MPNTVLWTEDHDSKLLLNDDILLMDGVFAIGDILQKKKTTRRRPLINCCEDEEGRARYRFNTCEASINFFVVKNGINGEGRVL